MTADDEHLFRILDTLFRIRNECSCGIFSECGLAELSVKQIRYLQTIDENGEVTFSRLAEITKTSKPTITETVDKFVRMDCVYRQPCPDDGRIRYIRLTEKGRRIANADRAALHRVIARIAESLSEDEMDLLIRLLQKVR